MRTIFLVILASFLLNGLPGEGPGVVQAEIVVFQEEFTSWEFRDETLTTAHWDTLDGQLELFPVGLDSLGFVATPGSALASSLVGNLMFVADNSDALISFDVTDPTAGTQLDLFATLDSARDVMVSGSYAFVSIGGLGVQSVNVGDPEDLVGAGDLDLGGFAYGMALQNDRLYVAQSALGVAVIDVSEPWNLQLVTSANSNDWARDVAIRGSELFVADSASGLTVMDISTPDSPVAIGSLTGIGFCSAVAVTSHHAYMATGPDGLVIVDITDPSDPLAQGSLVFPGNASCRNMTAVGDTLYAAVSDLGLFLIDVSDPMAPAIIGSHDTPGSAYHVSVNGTFSWVADSNGGMRAFELNPLSLDEENNLGISLNLTQEGEPVSRARLYATTNDSVAFDLTVDGGLNWHRIQPDDDWFTFEEPGDNFRWRASLVQTAPDLPPTCSLISLVFEKLHGYAGIQSVADVPEDTGGQVRVVWDPSRFDTPEAEFQVTEYSIYRRYDTTGAKQIIPDPAYPPGSWDFLTSVPADMENQYAAVVPTLADSTISQGMAWSVFFVRTRTTEAGVFFDSPPDSGYSLNNLQPDPPAWFVVDRSPAEGTALSWASPSDPDFSHFRLYRSASVSAPPLPGTLWQVTTGTESFDSDPGTWYYHLTLVNLAGQESEPATALSDVPAAAGKLHLQQNAPNPFNPLTRLSFSVPAGGAHVRLEVFDSRGRLLRVLRDEFLSPGDHTVAWDGKDDRGRAVGSGVYHGRIQGLGQVAAVKMVLVR